jgi:hypothetical protein
VKYTSSGAEFTVSKSGDHPTIQSNWYLLFGRVSFYLKAAPGTGIVSSAILQSDDLDEIDWEWLGGANYDGKVQSNYFGKGKFPNNTIFKEEVEEEEEANTSKRQHHILHPRRLDPRPHHTDHNAQLHHRLDVLVHNLAHRQRRRPHFKLRRRCRRAELPPDAHERPHRHLGRRRPRQRPGDYRVVRRRDGLQRGPFYDGA